MLISVCFFSLVCFILEEKFFLNVLLLFEFFIMGLFLASIYCGALKIRAMVGYLSIVILCVDVRVSVLGLALLVSSSRHSRK